MSITAIPLSTMLLALLVYFGLLTQGVGSQGRLLPAIRLILSVLSITMLEVLRGSRISLLKWPGYASLFPSRRKPARATARVDGPLSPTARLAMAKPQVLAF